MPADPPSAAGEKSHGKASVAIGNRLKRNVAGLIAISIRVMVPPPIIVLIMVAVAITSRFAIVMVPIAFYHNRAARPIPYDPNFPIPVIVAPRSSRYREACE